MQMCMFVGALAVVGCGTYPETADSSLSLGMIATASPGVTSTPILLPTSSIVPTQLSPSSTPPSIGTPISSHTATPNPTATLAPSPTRAAMAESQVLFQYSHALRLLKIREYKEAISAFGIVIRILPDFPLAYHGRGLAYHHTDRLELAIEDFDRAIDLKPDLAKAYHDRGVLKQELGDLDGAVADLVTALSLYENRGDESKIEQVGRVLHQLNP